MNQTKDYPVITISREFGSGGHSIAKKLAEVLQVPFYDKDIITKVAEKCGYTEEFIAEKGEHMNKAGRLVEKFLLSNAPGYYSPQDLIFETQKKIVLEVAKEPCVIVGRCADYILKKEGTEILNVFIHADDPFRVRHVEEHYGKTDIPTMKRICEKDKNRKAYYQHYTEIEWGNYKNYNICLDSGYLGEETCIKLLTEIAWQHMK